MLFQKRRVLYAADLARPAAREAGWVAVVEGYTDVIAAHQVGLTNVVGTLGTALGDDHVVALRRLADRVVLVFDGDEAGQTAADRSLELFLGHEVDVRVLTLPANLDPCDFLLERGGRARSARWSSGRSIPWPSRSDRAAARFDLDSLEGSRRAAEWVLAILAAVPDGAPRRARRQGGQGARHLSQRLRVPVDDARPPAQAVATPAAAPVRPPRDRRPTPARAGGRPAAGAGRRRRSGSRTSTRSTAS